MIPMALAVALLSFVSPEESVQQYRIDDVTFSSEGATLAGSIVFPKDRPAAAGIIFVHGSGKKKRNLNLAKKFAAAGIAALVYDKRGCGESGGKFEGKNPVSEKNIDLLANDAKEALKTLAMQAALADVPVGFTGLSQAGWIIPIAAEKSGVAQFMLLWSGPVCKVSEEDIFSKYTANSDAKNIPSYAAALKARQQPYVWPAFLGRDTNPSEHLRKLTLPGLWIFGANDGSVPVDLSIQRLEALRAAQHPYEYVLFSGVGHNNMSQTFATATDWILREVKK